MSSIIELDSTQINGDFTLTAGNTYLLKEDIEISGNLTIEAGARLEGNKKITVDFGGNLINNGEIETSSEILVNLAGNIVLNGKLFTSDNIIINIGGSFTNNGQLFTSSEVLVNLGGNFIINGILATSNLFTVNLGGNLIINGKFITSHDFTIQSGVSISLPPSGAIEASKDVIISGSLYNSGSLLVNGKIIVEGSLDNSGTINTDGELYIQGLFSNSQNTKVQSLYSEGIILNTSTIELLPEQTFHHHGGEVSGGGRILADSLRIEANPEVNLNNRPEAITQNTIFCGTIGQEPIFYGDEENDSTKVSKQEFLTNGEPTQSIIDEFVFLCNNLTTPIELQRFEAKASSDKTVVIEWITSSEQNNDYFEIQRSRDGLNWEKINQISGAGTTQTTQYYSTNDLRPHLGKSWYRLKQVDIDSNYTFSHTEEVNLSNITNNLSIYPNPSQDYITLSGNKIDLSQIKIFNSIGQDVSNLINIGQGVISKHVIDISALPANIYYLKINNEVHKLIKQ
ncbi:hypothetical protein GCM10025777_01960 [Membranihabitans marinus]